jgi:IclR family acetate operon transcriptional repressor
MVDKVDVSNAEGSASYLARMLNLLEEAVSAKGSLSSLSELAERAGMPVSTTSRLLGQLRSWGFLVEVDGGRIAPGPRLISMSAAVARTAYSDERLNEATRVLTAVTGESATASRIVGDHLMIVARTESGRPLRAVNRTGEVLPASRSAMGKAVLSVLPVHRQLDLLRAEGVEDPESTLAELADELRMSAERGYAVDEETLAVGLRCRAVAVLGWDGIPVAALSVGGPSVRFTAEVADESVLPLQSQAAELSGTGE